MKILLENVNDNREQWLALKNKTVGSSEIATVVGLNPYQTPLQLWMAKTGRAPAVEDNDAMRLGRLLESFIGEKFERDTGRMVRAANALYGHPSDDRFSASPDFFVASETGSDELIEAKNVNYRLAHKWADGDCPDAYVCQLQWQLGVLGLSSGYVAALIGGNVREYTVRRFESDPVVIDRLQNAAHDFLLYVERDIPPVAVANDRELIESAMVLDAEEVVVLPDNAAELCDAYESLVQAKKERESEVRSLKQEEDNIRAQLEQMLGSGSRGIVGDWTVKCSRVNRPAYTTKPVSYVSFSLKRK